MGSVTLALRTLGNFDFEGHHLTQFVRHCAENYLASEHKEIRMEAVKTCCRLLGPSLNVGYSSFYAILDQFLENVGVTEMSPI